jgi:hypothetical protein
MLLAKVRHGERFTSFTAVCGWVGTSVDFD